MIERIAKLYRPMDVDSHYLKSILSRKERGETAKQARASCLFASPLARWYSEENDTREEIVEAILQGEPLILELKDGRFYSVKLGIYTGCFD